MGQLTKRDERQIALANVLLEKKKGTVQAVTGFGKTRVALLALSALARKRTLNKVWIIVPTIMLKKQWTALVEKFDVSVTVETIHAARKLGIIKADVIIMDEAHNFASEQSIRVFRKIHCDYLWCLSATMERNDQRHELIYQFAPLVGNVTMEEAEREGYVSKFAVYNLALKLEGEDKDTYDLITDIFDKNFRYFNRDLNTVQGVLRNPGYAASLAKRFNVETGILMGKARACYKAMMERKKFLSEHQRKLDIAKELIDKSTDKVITFGSNIETVKRLTELLGKTSKSYHSQQTKKVREKIIENFNKPDSKIRTLNSARALDEGADIAGLTIAIVLSRTSTKRQNTQRMGRVLRAAPGKIATIVNIYFEDTQDEKWLNKQTEMLSTKKVYDAALINFD